MWDVKPSGFTAVAGAEGVQTADFMYGQIFQKDPYFARINPFRAKSECL